MIEIKTKVHDKFSIEFKVWFLNKTKLKKNDFKLGMWIMMPSSLGIHPSVYSKEDFYRDLHTNVRLITPQFTLSQLASSDSLPFKMLKTAAENLLKDENTDTVSEFESQARLYVAIAKSSLRNEAVGILETGQDEEITSRIRTFAAEASETFSLFTSLWQGLGNPVLSDKVTEIYNRCAFFLCYITDKYSVALIRDLTTRHLESAGSDDIVALMEKARDFSTDSKFPHLEEDNPEGNSRLFYLRNLVKKYVESPLYLRVPKKRDGFIAEQAYYSVAAGIAMLFATVVAWAFQKTFGNLTWPLFIALIISYMMKDRIKELMRYYFAHKKGFSNFDRKAKMSIRGNKVGTLREAMDFISLSNVPEDVLNIYKKSLPFVPSDFGTQKTFLLYRKQVKLDNSEMDIHDGYEYAGLNDIIRLNVRSFVYRMDNPQSSGYILDENRELKEIPVSRDYYINIILRYQHSDQMDYKHFQVTLNRDGIRKIEEI